MGRDLWILGIAASHNGGAALVREGRVVAAVQQERLSRVKRDLVRIDPIGDEVWALARYCTEAAGIGIDDIDVIATSSPWAAAFPNLNGAERPTRARFMTVPHHLAHAEYVVHYAPRERSLVLICDGSGTMEANRPRFDIREHEREAVKHLDGDARESISAYAYDGQRLELIYRLARAATAFRLPTGQISRESLGHLWRWAAWYCCGDPNDAGKVMGLAPYGDPDAVGELGLVTFDSATGDARISFDALAALTRPNVERRDVAGEAHYENIAAHLQAVTNTFLESLVRFLAPRAPAANLCFAGGVALNGIGNEHLIRSGTHRLIMNGSCEDNGTAIGAALAVHHQMTGERNVERINDYYGCEYSDADVECALRDAGLSYRELREEDLFAATSSAIADGKVVGWLQGRSEFGPRALGNRSILADPRRDDMRDRLNHQIKHRESYRPYAPAVLENRAAEFFAMDGSSPSMLRVVSVRTGSSLPAITHVDGSARVQTVAAEDNPRFHRLLENFGVRTGVPVLLNTSFNVAGQPIVESPRDAVAAFVGSGLDALVMRDFVSGL